jgi:hypothetical protein
VTGTGRGAQGEKQSDDSLAAERIVAGARGAPFTVSVFLPIMGLNMA